MNTKKTKAILGVVVALSLFTAFTVITYIGNQRHYISTTDSNIG